MKKRYWVRTFILAGSLLLQLHLGPHPARGQNGLPLWTNRYNGPGNGNDIAYAVAVDGNGNVFVTGESTSTNGFTDYATFKYSSAGVPAWTNRYNGGAFAVAVDGNGSVFVTGNSTGSGGDSDYATIKYSNAGAALWTNRYNGPANGDDGVRAMTVDSNGNVFVTGSSTGSGGDSDYATIKYSGAGVPLWTNRFGGPGNTNDAATAIAVDGSGNVFVAGYSTGSGGDLDYVTIKYSSAGTALWTNRYDGAGGNDVASAVAVDGSGNVFVTGYAAWVFVYFDPNLEDYVYSYGSDYTTIAYSGAGVGLWERRYNGGEHYYNEPRSVAVDGGGNVIVTGTAGTIKYSSAGTTLWNRYDGSIANAVAVDVTGNVFVTGNGGGPGYATLAYSGAGMALWTNRYGGPGYNAATAIAVDGSGNVFVTGLSYGTNGYSDYATIKYSSAVPPSLTIARTTSNTVAVSWPSPSTGFTLQQNPNGIATVNWSNLLTTPTDNGTTKTVIVNPSTANSYFRLSNP